MKEYGKRVLVAGATGYLGRFVAKEFKSRGYYVRALTRSSGKLASLTQDIDEEFIGEVTDSVSLKGICDDVDIVFSSVGITRQKDGLTFRDVDYQGNMNLLEEALSAGVKKFIYVSVFNAEDNLHLDIVRAHEDFVEALNDSGMDYTVLRPTGYFSDMEEFLEMARKGTVYLFGDGSSRMNPIHGSDLAVTCVDAVQSPDNEIEVGGPETFSYGEIAELAQQAVKRRVKIRTTPLWMIKAAIVIAKLFNRHKGELLAFFVAASTNDVVAPTSGSLKLANHFQECVRVFGD